MDSNIETSLSHLSTSSVAGKESITDCLKQCALTAGCLKAKYGLDSCELKGSDLAHVDGKSFGKKKHYKLTSQAIFSSNQG